MMHHADSTDNEQASIYDDAVTSTKQSNDSQSVPSSLLPLTTSSSNTSTSGMYCT
jgi:hypothetical protein